MRRWHWVSCALVGAGVLFCQGPTGIERWARADKGSDKASAKKQRAIRRCVQYRQEQYDDGLKIRLKNQCELDIECTISWSVRCDQDGPETQRSKAEVLMIDRGMTDGAYASAAACGDDGWRISRVRWSCRDAAE